MTDRKNDGGPAFAHGNPEQGGDPGISIRDWLAGQALAGLAQKMSADREHAINNGDVDASWEASLAYSLADAVLAAREDSDR